MLGRSPSSISREIKRNTWFPSNENESYRPYRPKRLKAGPWTGRYYIAGPAQRKADRRRSKPRKPYRLSHDRLWAQVPNGWAAAGRRCSSAAGCASCGRTMRSCACARRPSTDGSTPAGRFGNAGRGACARAQAAPQARRQEDVALPDPRPSAHLRRRRRRRQERVRPLGGRQRHRSGMQPAHRGGEEDQVPHGPHRSGQDRRRERRGAAGHVLAAAGRARVSVTHDNGTEFAHHERLRDGLGMATYFADPYSSWQRGSNENRNGMIRRYLPKRCEIRMDMAKEVREIVDEINNRPMRVLGYRTPAEAFADELLELQDQQGCCTSK